MTAACFPVVRFEGSNRTYTYHADEPLLIGDWVVVETKNGLSRLKVVDVLLEAPAFATKLARRVSPPDEPGPAEAHPGHNNPPPEAISAASLEADAVAYAHAAETWATQGVSDELAASKATDAIETGRRLWKRAEDLRKAQKQPHMDAAAAVDAEWKPVLERLKAGADAIKQVLEAYLKQVAERQRAEAEAARKAAADEARRAEAARRQAEAAAAANVNAQVDAELARQRADAAAKAAADAAAARPRAASLTGQARTTSLKVARTAVIEDPNRAFMALMRIPPARAALMDELTRLANAEVRSAKGGDIAIPGVRIDIEEKLHV